MKKTGFLGMFLVFFCLMLFGCGRDEVVIEQAKSGRAQETEMEESGSKAESKEQNSEKAEEKSQSSGQQENHRDIWVDVSGAVKTPGVYRLKENARVFEAVQAAGGFSEQADTQWLNQAALLVDGEKIQVYTLEETRQMKEQGAIQPGAASDPEGSSDTESREGGKVNINTADAAGLQEIPGIGEVRAKAIVDYREENGLFGNIEAIQEVPGIKGKTFEKIQNYITTE